MAFQCRSCFKDKSWFDIAMHSHGPCENCGFTDYCVDAPFDIDPHWKTNVHKDLVAAGLTSAAAEFKKKVMVRA